jgi:hypothetical protein
VVEHAHGDADEGQVGEKGLDAHGFSHSSHTLDYVEVKKRVWGTAKIISYTKKTG